MTPPEAWLSKKELALRLGVSTRFYQASPSESDRPRHSLLSWKMRGAGGFFLPQQIGSSSVVENTASSSDYHPQKEVIF